MSKLDFIDKPIATIGEPKFKVISTFSGCGGSSLGYMWAGGKVLLAVEWDDNAVETYRLNFPQTTIFHGDIAKLSVEQALEMAGVKAGELDIFDGSPPCQGFSTAGKRQIDDPRNQLFKEYIRLLRRLRPKVFIMENVSGMVKGKMKLIFAEIMQELKASGYQVSARLMDAAYFGVPQHRQRMIFIGVRNDLGIMPSHPKGQSELIPIKSVIPYAKKMSTNKNYQSVWVFANRPAVTITKSGGNEKGGMIEIEILPEMLLQDNELTRLYEKIPIGNSAEIVTTKGRNFNNMIKPDPNKPMIAIPKTVTNRGAFSITHWSEKRLFSIPELKRLASYPDNFKFCGKFTEQWARIGNSVPPRFMQAIAEHVYENILSKVSSHLTE